MTCSHSGNPENESELLRQFREQVAGQHQRAWPEGRISGDDDGQVVFRVGGDREKQVVILDFGQDVTWVGMPPQQAVDLARSLIQHARQISNEPISFVM